MTVKHPTISDLLSQALGCLGETGRNQQIGTLDRNCRPDYRRRDWCLKFAITVCQAEWRSILFRSDSALSLTSVRAPRAAEYSSASASGSATL
jgi:hypothetical protein